MAKILIAEDDRDVRELIIFTLRFVGHEVWGVTNGEEALQQAKLNPPDLILLDVRMPKMNGFEACRLLKAEQVTTSIPVIFLSVRGEEADVQVGISAGADDYIIKPIGPNQLAEKIKFHLEKAGR
jgi:DNA-binding response OmpR family regulator